MQADLYYAAQKLLFSGKRINQSKKEKAELYAYGRKKDRQWQ